MYLTNKEYDLENFLDALGFIPPKGTSVKYFISPKGIDVPEGSGFELEEKKPDFSNDGSQTYIMNPPIQKHDQATTPAEYSVFEVEALPRRQPTPNVLPEITEPEDLPCPFVKVLSESQTYGIDIQLLEDFGPFLKNTLFHCVPKKLDEGYHDAKYDVDAGRFGFLKVPHCDDCGQREDECLCCCDADKDYPIFKGDIDDDNVIDTGYFDWKDERVNGFLHKWSNKKGVKIYSHPECEDTDMYGFVVCRESLNDFVITKMLPRGVRPGKSIGGTLKNMLLDDVENSGLSDIIDDLGDPRNKGWNNPKKKITIVRHDPGGSEAYKTAVTKFRDEKDTDNANNERIKYARKFRRDTDTQSIFDKIYDGTIGKFTGELDESLTKDRQEWARKEMSDEMICDCIRQYGTATARSWVGSEVTDKMLMKYFKDDPKYQEYLPTNQFESRLKSKARKFFQGDDKFRMVQIEKLEQLVDDGKITEKEFEDYFDRVNNQEDITDELRILHEAFQDGDECPDCGHCSRDCKCEDEDAEKSTDPRKRSDLKEGGGYYKSPHDPSPRSQWYENVTDIIKDYRKGIISIHGVMDIAEHFGWEDDERIVDLVEGDSYEDEDEECEWCGRSIGPKDGGHRDDELLCEECCDIYDEENKLDESLTKKKGFLHNVLLGSDISINTDSETCNFIPHANTEMDEDIIELWKGGMDPEEVLDELMQDKWYQKKFGKREDDFLDYIKMRTNLYADNAKRRADYEEDSKNFKSPIYYPAEGRKNW